MSDHVVIGDMNPVPIGGLNIHLHWRFIELTMDLNWSYGSDIINDNVCDLMDNGDTHSKSVTCYKDT